MELQKDKLLEVLSYLNLKEMSKKTGISYSALRAWRNGDSVPRVDSLLTLAAALHIDMRWFLEAD